MRINSSYLKALTTIIFFSFITASCSDDNNIDRVTEIIIEDPQIKTLANGEEGVVIKLNEGVKKLQASTKPESLERKLIFRGAADNIFTINESGELTPKSEGYGALIIQPDDESGFFKNVKVEVRLDGLKATKEGANFEVQQTRTFDLSKEIIITLDEGIDRTLMYEAVNKDLISISADGKVTGLELGETAINIWSKAFPQFKLTVNVTIVERRTVYTDLDRAKWTSTQSHNRPDDAAIINAANSHIDNNYSSCLSLVKPGKSYDGITVQPGESVYFIVDMQEKQTFNYMRLRHRASTPVAARLLQASIYGSNDGSNFTLIAEKLNLPDVEDQNKIETGNAVFADSAYRYVKVEFTKWDPSARSTVQIAEFYLGTKD